MSKPGTKQIGGFVIGVAVLGAALTVIASRKRTGGRSLPG